jgi:hypothetical protein
LGDVFEVAATGSLQFRHSTGTASYQKMFREDFGVVYKQTLSTSNTVGGVDNNMFTFRLADDVDAMVIRGNGNINIAGVVSFASGANYLGDLNLSGNRILNVGAPLTGGEATNRNYVLNAISAAADDDGSATNEIQTFDVSTLVGTKLNLSLSEDGQSTKEIDLNPIITRGISTPSGASNASTGGAGVYTVTHNFGAVATAISCNANGGTFYHVQVTSKGTNSFTVKIFNADGSQETSATNIFLDSILTFK